MITLRVKTSLARLHIESSSLFSNLCQQIENEEEHLDWPQPRWDEARSYALSSVVLSVAALESSINELYQQAIDKDKNALGSLTDEQLSLLEQLWPEVEKFPILRKYQIVLTAKSRESLTKGTEPYQSATALVSLRNALVHFKPEWDDSLNEHQKLEAKLKSYFGPNRLANKAKGRMVWFPHKCLGASCAMWSYNTAKRFSEHFCKTMDIKARF
jgi:hypothetical protein